MSDKFEQVQGIIAEQLDIPVDKISLESNLLENLEADSLDIIELVMAFEEEFDMKIPDEDLEKIKTVADIIEALS
ncbi:acyl carrier protein [Eubacterium aggregans]|uniref:acyl carrier protein n=1 Tax=Eubacterium aggregans TaxID=81409 RepID=UPI003F2AEC3F